MLIRDPAGTFAPQALRCTDQDAAPEQNLGWFVQRWQREVTGEEARRHLGGETQRQWSELAIGWTTPALLGLFSLETLLAHPHMAAGGRVRQAAWSPRLARRSRTRWPWSGATYGSMRLFARRSAPQTWYACRAPS